jgi:hypothetical protein
MVHSCIIGTLLERSLCNQLRLGVNPKIRVTQNVKEFVKTLLLSNERMILNEQVFDVHQEVLTICQNFRFSSLNIEFQQVDWAMEILCQTNDRNPRDLIVRVTFIAGTIAGILAMHVFNVTCICSIGVESQSGFFRPQAFLDECDA